MFFTQLSLSVVLTDENITAYLKNAGKPVFLKAWATWCPHCKQLAPIWEELINIEKFNEKIIFADIECEQNRKSCKKLGVENYPVLFWNDEANNASFRYSGERTLEQLKLFIQKQLHFPLISIDSSEVTDYLDAESNTSAFLFTIDENDHESLKVAKLACALQRASSAQFLLVHSSGEAKLQCFAGSDFEFQFTDEWKVDIITNFIKLHTIKPLVKADGYVVRHSDENNFPIFVIILNKTGEIPENIRNYARVASSYVMTAITNCHDDIWFCRFVDLFPTEENPKYVLYYNRMKKFWVYDENIPVDEFITAVKNNKIKAQGPGTGVLSIFKNPFYDAKMDGRSPPYGLVLIPIMFVILVLYVLHDMNDKAFKVD